MLEVFAIREKAMQVTSKKLDRCALWAISCAVTFVVWVLIAMAVLFFIPTRTLEGIFFAGFVLLPTAGFVLGVFAICKIVFFHREARGFWHAVLAVFLCTPVILLMISGIYVARARAEKEKANTGAYNLRLLGNELNEYAQDHDGYLPNADSWCDALMEHNKRLSKENFRHPKAQEFYLTGECHFAFNKSLSATRLPNIPDDVVLLFEADGNWNLNGGPELLALLSKERGYINVLLVSEKTKDCWLDEPKDNLVRAVGVHKDQLRWKP